MAVTGGFFTRFTIFLWCGIGFLLVSLYHILMSGYNMRAGFMLLLSLALLAAAFTERKKRQIRAWQEEQAQKSKEETERKKDKGGMKQ
jgi:membrane protein implicated in regulation of membrane protease activity